MSLFNNLVSRIRGHQPGSNNEKKRKSKDEEFIDSQSQADIEKQMKKAKEMEEELRAVQEEANRELMNTEKDIGAILANAPLQDVEEMDPEAIEKELEELEKLLQSEEAQGKGGGSKKSRRKSKRKVKKSRRKSKRKAKKSRKVKRRAQKITKRRR